MTTEKYTTKSCADLKASFGLRSHCCGNRGDLYRSDGLFLRRYEIIPENRIAEVYSGFEICSHGANHNSFAGKNVEELKNEIYPDMEFFGRLTGNKVIGAIYPGGVCDDASVENLKKIGVKFCRTIPDGTYNMSVPTEWERWIPTCHFQDEKIFEVIDEFDKIDKGNDTILHIFGHSYELEYKNCNWWNKFEKVCRVIKNMKNVRYASMGEIYDYFVNDFVQ